MGIKISARICEWCPSKFRHYAPRDRIRVSESLYPASPLKVLVELGRPMGHRSLVTLVLDLPDSWAGLLGPDSGEAAARARHMLVLEGYREGRLSRGQVSGKFPKC